MNFITKKIHAYLDTSILEVFVKHGVDVNSVANAPGFEATTPLQNAIEKKEEKKIKF